MELVAAPADLPTGSHAISFYANASEAATRVASFLKGAERRGQSGLVLTDDDGMATLYRQAIEIEAPRMADALRRIPGPHLRPTDRGFRPVEEVGAFVAAHPDGVSMCGDTIPRMMDRNQLRPLLAYEHWFDSLRPFPHRGLCPYDVNRFPVDRAAEAFTDLVKSHSHAVLSTAPDPSAQFLQLLLVPLVDNPTEAQRGWLLRATDLGLIEEPREEGRAPGLTPRGEQFARALRGRETLAAVADG
jgi:hypothetical protein